MMGLIINLGGLFLMAAIIWWFWVAKPRAAQVVENAPIDVLVDGGVYTPALIDARVGKELALKFLRKDASPCAEKVIFDELGQSYDLIVGQPLEVRLTPDKAGEISFTCQMGMYQGRIHVS